MMKILVTGANGLLGQKLVALIDHSEGVNLVATARGKNRSGASSDKYRSLDITNAIEVEQVISETKPDVVINTAAMTQVDQCETDREACWLANVTAVEHLIKACSKTNSHLVHVSTDFIFDGTHGPLNESDVPNPVNYYGESKLAGEKAILNSTIKWCIIRTVLVYGITNDQSRSNIVLWVKKNLEEGKFINVVNDQWRTPTLAEDLAMGCYLAATKRSRGIYHVSGEEMMTPYDIAITTADFFKLDKSLIKSTNSTLFKQTAKRPAKTGFSIVNAKKDLGYQPHSFQAGLAILSQQIQT